jgi:hypothetical protein
MTVSNNSIAISHLQILFNSLLEAIEDGDFKTSLLSKFDQSKPNFDGIKIGYCINRFVEAELDFETKGDRGIGRISSNPPRFGAYSRKQLSNVSKSDLESLRENLIEVMLSAYLVGLMFDEKEVPVEAESEVLFDRWIPNIYVTPFDMLGENLQSALLLFCETPYKHLLDIIDRLNLNPKRFLKKDYIHTIFSFYLVAGWGLRHIEMND